MNLVVDDGQSPGLMIRGGHEFSLGIYITGIDKAKQKSPVSGHWSASKVVRWTLFFVWVGGICDTCVHRDYISHLQSMVAKRGLTSRANVHTPM